jgi:virulence factor Mce-like protein
MRRVFTSLVLICAATAFVVLSAGAGGSSGEHKYWVELDNAFGLIKGGDLKIAGVRAGKITELKLDKKTNRALIGFKITRNGFGSLRTDVHCDSRPQSLIGEYFVDCKPGTAPTELKSGSTIPVSHTTSTVGPDLVNDILRRPYHERLALLINELGAGVAGNGKNLNDAIRRAAPALRETDKVLEILGKQDVTLRDLATNADKVIGALAANHKNVGRWVKASRGAAVDSASRAAAIREGFRRLPGFLKQLQPTMAALGATADAQTPALRNLNASAKQLKNFFDNLGDFSQASTPAFKALGKAAGVGDQAVIAAKPAITELRRFTRGTPELAKNLDIVLKHLDDPQYNAEIDARAAKATGRAAPTGYTGLESLLTYVYDQTEAINIFDQNSHILKISLIPPNQECADYADAAAAKKLYKECGSYLGPNQPGINFVDASKPAGVTADNRGGADKKQQSPIEKLLAPVQPILTPKPVEPAKKAPSIDLSPLIPGLPEIKLPPGLGKILGQLQSTAQAQARDKRSATSLLDYLLR